VDKRGRPGLARLQGSATSNQTDRNINAPSFIGSKERTKVDSTHASAEGTIPLGRTSITLGGTYSQNKVTQSLPENKIGIPENVQNHIYKQLSAGLGYDITDNLNIAGFIDASKIKGGKNKTSKTLQVSGDLKGNRFVGSFEDRASGEKVGKFSLVIPFAHGGKVKPRGRKAKYGD
tara:strand:- start:49 stop:576 length:528 start_codon:yes stop_codon:yes gene_type:complete